MNFFTSKLTTIIIDIWIDTYYFFVHLLILGICTCSSVYFSTKLHGVISYKTGRLLPIAVSTSNLVHEYAETACISTYVLRFIAVFLSRMVMNLHKIPCFICVNSWLHLCTFRRCVFLNSDMCCNRFCELLLRVFIFTSSTIWESHWIGPRIAKRDTQTHTHTHTHTCMHTHK